MQSRDQSFTFSPTFNFATDSVFVNKSNEYSPTPPPVTGNFELLDGSDFLLLDGTNLLLL